MKILLTLLLLIPSLSWGFDFKRNDISEIKTELNDLFGYELGSKFDLSQLNSKGLEKFEKFSQNSTKKYTHFIRVNKNKPNALYNDFNLRLESPIFDNVFISINNKSLKIESIVLHKLFDSNKVNNSSNCDELQSTYIDTYLFKRNIKEITTSFYEYTQSNSSNPENQINNILSISLLKDLKHNFLYSQCVYQNTNQSSGNQKNISLSFGLNSLSYYKDISNLYKNDFNNTIEINKNEFEKIVNIFLNFDLNKL